MPGRTLDATCCIRDGFQSDRRNPLATFDATAVAAVVDVLKRRFDLRQGRSHAAKHAYRKVLLADFAGAIGRVR